MEHLVYIEGVGYCKEITIYRVTDDVPEPYSVYEQYNK